MKLVYGIITCDRAKYFGYHLSTLIETMDAEHDWHIIIADDFPTRDYTSSYVKMLQGLGYRVSLIESYRRGPHYLVNRILKIASEEEFDYGFMVEDDIFFMQKGWDNLYIKASQLSSFDYLCYFNSEWARNHSRGSCVCPKIKLTGKRLQSEVKIFSCFGCFWTFSPRIIKEVGYFDMNNFGVWGSGHTDYSKRCCRLGHNGIDGRIFDMLDSEKYVKMQDNGYVTTGGGGKEVDSGLVGVPNGKHKGLFLNVLKRVYVPYNEIELDMLGREVV